MRVGSCDKDASGEESDHQDGADELRKTGSGGIYGRHAEKASAVSTDMLEIPVKVVTSLRSSVSTSLWASNTNSSGSVSLQVSSSSEISPSSSRSISLRVSSLSENPSASSSMVGK